MEALVSFIVFLIVFSVLILVHEFGHFYAARRAGVKVEEFGMGLPPRAKGLWTDKQGTLYSLNWIPFGGFVRMYGEDATDEEMWNKKGSFGSKSIAWRTLIILGGVIMNFLMGFIILVVLFSTGTEPIVATLDDFQHYREQGIITAENSIQVTGFAEDSPAEAAGLLQGDQILRVNELEVDDSASLISALEDYPSSAVELEVSRDDQEQVVEVLLSQEGKMGVVIADVPHITEVKEIVLPFTEAVTTAAHETVRLSWLTMKMFVNVIFTLFTTAEVSPQVSGPVGIAQLIHNALADGGIAAVMKLVALLSISLGAINVIPIPALDGGRFLSIFFEVVTRKRPDAAFEAKIHAFGFVLILFLIVAVTYNDIVRLIAG